MTTPFGPAIATYASKKEFYDHRPDLAEGWNPDAHPGSAALGGDLYFGHGTKDPEGRWLVIFCAPEDRFRGQEPKGSGTVVAFDRETEKHHVLAEDIDFPTAKQCYVS